MGRIHLRPVFLQETIIMKIEQILKNPDAYIGKVIEVEGYLIYNQRPEYITYLHPVHSVDHRDSIFLNHYMFEWYLTMTFNYEVCTERLRDIKYFSDIATSSSRNIMNIHRREKICKLTKCRSKLIKTQELAGYYPNNEFTEKLMAEISEFPLALVEIETIDIHRLPDHKSFFFSSTELNYDNYSQKNPPYRAISDILTNLDALDSTRIKTHGVLLETTKGLQIPPDSNFFDHAIFAYNVPSHKMYLYRCECQIIGTITHSDNPEFGAQIAPIDQTLIDRGSYIECWDYSKPKYVEGN